MHKDSALSHRERSVVPSGGPINECCVAKTSIFIVRIIGKITHFLCDNNVEFLGVLCELKKECLCGDHVRLSVT
jgi:hypothetical protein